MLKLPFSVAKNENELINNIKNFNNKEYLKKLDSFYNELGLFEDGKASERVVDEILKVVGVRHEKR